MITPILHHFEASPFSEKIRLVFGFKDLAWQSCLIPRILPKPDLMPLTGGYRRTPVMQIGADIYCDTQIILRAIEKHVPTPPLYPPALMGAPHMLALWSDRAFFETTVRLVFGSLGDKVPQAFIEDRTKLRGAPFDVEAMAAGVALWRAHFRAHVALIEAQLAHGQDFLFGPFTAADAHAFMNVWYVRSNLPDQADALLDHAPRTRAWERRLRAIGHGRRVDVSGAQALQIAKDAQPASDVSAHASGTLQPGTPVVVAADEPVKTPIEGILVHLSADEIAIRRSDPAVGDVVVHFPAIGYGVSAS
jgi:glutathione S-transferase